MTPEQRAAFVMAQAGALMAHVYGMVAENERARQAGKPVPYGLTDFQKLPTDYGINHNQVITLFQQ